MVIRINLNLITLLDSLFQKLKPRTLRDQHRPAELPPVAPDCGWNHGEDRKR